MITNKITPQQEKLLEFVKECHGDQVRKYTGEPYWTHVYEVGLLADDWHVTLGLEIGFCHDLLEDTECGMATLFDKLESLSYRMSDIRVICDCVRDLTDVYITEDYPQLNRRQRKEKECMRLSDISPLAQSVKYADLIHNTKSIVKHDKGFAKVYLEEKENILRVMNGGCGELYSTCISILEAAKKELVTDAMNESILN